MTRTHKKNDSLTSLLLSVVTCGQSSDLRTCRSIGCQHVNLSYGAIPHTHKVIHKYLPSSIRSRSENNFTKQGTDLVPPGVTMGKWKSCIHSPLMRPIHDSWVAPALRGNSRDGAIQYFLWILIIITNYCTIVWC